MAYPQFQDNKPAASDTGLVAIDNMRDNMRALRDSVIVGFMPGWDYAKVDGTGTAEQPQYHTYTKGLEVIRVELTWGTTGGADGNVTTMVMEKSNDGGTAWDPMGTYSQAYDSAGNPTVGSWVLP
ncbi:MAG: hypothetical protein AAGI88_24975 [Pseudomonadota bacterium]